MKLKLFLGRSTPGSEREMDDAGKVALRTNHC